jgi:hypothetical protein
VHFGLGRSSIFGARPSCTRVTLAELGDGEWDLACDWRVPILPSIAQTSYWDVPTTRDRIHNVAGEDTHIVVDR